MYDESGIFILTNGYLTEGRKNAKNIQVAERIVPVSWVENAYCLQYIIDNCYLLSVISKDNVVIDIRWLLKVTVMVVKTL